MSYEPNPLTDAPTAPYDPCDSNEIRYITEYGTFDKIEEAFDALEILVNSN